MRRISRAALGVCLAVSLLSAPALAQTRGAQQGATPAGSGTHRSYRKGYEIVEAGLAALGGLEALRAAEDVSLKMSGVTWARNQSVRVEPPFDQMPRDESMFVNFRRGVYTFENCDPLPGGFLFGNKVVIGGGQGYAVNPVNKTIQPLNPANFPNITFNYVRRLPHLLLVMALEQRAQSLRYRGEETFDGRRHNVVDFSTPAGLVASLFFDAKTNLLSKYDSMLTDGVDGDVVQETIFPEYQTVGGIKVPTRRITRRGGDAFEDVKYTDVRFNTRPPESAFTKPEGHEELPAPSPPPTRETKLAEGVYLFESGANSLVVEFKDYVVVVEPYGGGRGPKPTINKVREMFPSKPLKYVVAMHHHDDHSGGVRSYVAEGVTVVTTPANQKYFERMASGVFTINADDQTRKPRPPAFDFVRDRKRVFTDGAQTLEIIDIGPSPHAGEMLIAYLPKEKLVFQGDLINLPPSGKYLPSVVNDTTVHFADAVRKLNLDVRRIAAVHGPATTWDDLREAIEKKRAAR